MIKKVGVVGAGMMGAEIALCFAREGFETVLNDIRQEIADRGKEKQAQILDKRIKKGKMSPQDKEAILSRVTATGNLEDLAECDLIIEAVLEVFDVKKSVYEKLDAICKKVYHAEGVTLTPAAQKQAAQLKDLGFGGLPICMAKTQYSFSDQASALGAPENFRITVRELKVSAGAHFVVALTGTVLTMPGLPKVPAAEKIDVDDNGVISGLF